MEYIDSNSIASKMISRCRYRSRGTASLHTTSPQCGRTALLKGRVQEHGSELSGKGHEKSFGNFSTPSTINLLVVLSQ